MLLSSDITNPSLPFKEGIPIRGAKAFEHEKSEGGYPLFTIELRTNQAQQRTDIKVQKHEAKKNGWIYRTKFDGRINGPNDFWLLLKWLEII